ncbi:ElyC/SanA/YdcF family protein [Helicobacter sp. 23-1044]
MKFIKTIFRHCAIFIATLVCVGILAFAFRDFLAQKYADFFYFEKMPSDFRKDDFMRFSHNLAQNFTKFAESKNPKIAESHPKNPTDSANRTKFAESRPKSAESTADSAPKRAILLLGGGVQSRLFYAVALYIYGVSDMIFITNPASYIEYDFGGAIQSEVAQMKGALDFAKVNYKIIPPLNPLGAQSTRDEALDIANFLSQNALDELIIITSEFHSKRAHTTFSKIFAESSVETKLYIFPAPNRIFNRQNWHRSELGIMNYALEAPKLLLFYANDSQMAGVKAH